MKANERPAVGKHISLKWHDCYTIDEWTDITELLQRKKYHISTVGFFLGVADGNWVVASALSKEDSKAAATWIIPSKMILSWEPLPDA